jgi:hypothetical protein
MPHQDLGRRRLHVKHVTPHHLRNRGHWHRGPVNAQGCGLAVRSRNNQSLQSAQKDQTRQTVEDFYRFVIVSKSRAARRIKLF